MNRPFSSALWIMLVSLGTSMLYAAPAAQVGPLTISEEEMNQDIGLKISQYQSQTAVFDKQHAWLEERAQVLLFELAAKEAKVSVPAWKKKEIDSQVIAPTPEEIDNIVKAISQQAAQRGELVSSPERQATYKKQATEYLASQKAAQREAQVVAALRQKYPVTIQIAPPPPPDAALPIGPNDSVKGPANARVTIVEYTDIECPYCKRAQPTLHQILAAYPNDVKLVSKNFPLPMHKRAIPAAEAGLCAKEQGKFWEYRAKTFESPSLEDTDLLRFAKELTLNEKKFKQCIDSHKMLPQIDASIAEGRSLGVNSTPHFFVNLREVRGGQPFEAFKAAIDQELARK